MQPATSTTAGSPAARPRDVLQVDVVCVGAGVASLSAALRFLDRVRSEGGASRPPHVLIFDKGRDVGSHVLSGAVVDPRPLEVLLGQERMGALPVEAEVTSEAFYYLTAARAWKLPVTPPPMRSRGFLMVSLSKVSRWLATLCEQAGAEVYAGCAVTELLESGDGRVVGVRLGDRGLDRMGRPKPNFEPGPDVHAQVVVLGEGASGALTEPLIARKRLAADSHVTTYALGIKERIRVPARPGQRGKVVHTFGYPLDAATYGGGFLYGLSDTDWAVGLVVGLDYTDPMLSPHELFRAWKAHPMVRAHLAEGRVVGYGAKVIPEGGYFAVPRLVTEGVLLVGDGAGLLDSVRLKGVDLAVESGLAAGDTLFDCWRHGDWSLGRLAEYENRIRKTAGWRRLRRYRNVRACFQRGLWAGVAATAVSYVTAGFLPWGRIRMEPDAVRTRPATGDSIRRAAVVGDPALQLDILTDLFYSGTEHEEDQPCHLVIKDPARCASECLPKFRAPCTRVCPAGVYELAEDGRGVRIQAANCLHCGTCEIKDPLRNIEWKLPEGGGGPRYRDM